MIRPRPLMEMNIVLPPASPHDIHMVHTTPADLWFSVMHMDAQPDCGALWREFAPDSNRWAVHQFLYWHYGGARADDDSRWARLTLGSPTLPAVYILDFHNMTSTRIWIDVATGAEIQGRSRQLKLDVQIAGW